MKTTIEIEDSIFRQLKARAALKGKTMRGYINEAIMEKLKQDADSKREKGWKAVFGKGPKQAIEELQASLDEEFSKIDPKDWP
jgi:hypothetical protein